MYFFDPFQIPEQIEQIQFVFTASDVAAIVKKRIVKYVIRLSEDLMTEMAKIDRASNFENTLKDLKDEKLISNKNKINQKRIRKLQKINGSFCDA